ncbi:retrovirus-related pol polyprotein from transposon TNT 1-94 [Tanacetum coccineum]
MFIIMANTRRVWKSVRYGISKGLDTAYWSFLEHGYTVSSLMDTVYCELEKLIEKRKGKSVETKFDKPSIVRQPNSLRIPKPSVLGKPTSFSDSIERKSFKMTKLVTKTNVLEGLSKPVNKQILPQTPRQAVRNTNVLKPGMYGIDTRPTQTRAPRLPQTSMNIDPCVVYYVEGLNHNLFSVGQFCNADLEVAFWKSTCFVRDLQGNDLLTGNRESDLYIISLQETNSSTLICFMAKASPTQAWLWHRTLSHLKFNYINFISKKDIMIGLPKLKYVKDQLCSSCELSKAKRSSFKTKVVPSSKVRLNLLHMDLCGPMRIESINGKKYILDETPEVLKDFLKTIQRNLQAQVITFRTDRGTKFLNKTLHAYFKEEGIDHQTSTPLFYRVIPFILTSTPRTPEQNNVIERRNRTLVEAARTMLSSSKLHLDGKNLDKMKEKGDPCIMVGYSTQSKGYRGSDYDNSGPAPQLQNVSPSADKTGPSQQELDLLFGPLYDEFFTTSTSSVNKSSSPTDNSTQQDTPPTTSIQPTTEPITPTINVNAEENNNDQATDANIDENNIRVILFSIHSEDGNPSRAIINQDLRWYKRWCCSLIPAESDSLPHAHAQTTKTYYKHQDLRIKKAQVHTKIKTSANSNIQDLPLRYQVYQGRLLASFQEDAKYDHVGQDSRSQDGKDDNDKQGKDLKILELKINSKDND